jgi:uncharacterized protein (DUF1778 family)
MIPAAVGEGSFIRIAICTTWLILGSEEFFMTRAAERKEYPLSMRLPEADIAIIDRAAGRRGRSRTDFIREAAVRAAEDVLMENTLIRMSAQGFKTFLRAIAGPAKPVPEMVELAGRTPPWEISDESNQG